MNFKYKNIFFVYFLLGIFSLAFGKTISLSPAEIKQIGDQVFVNECAGKDECLMEWSEGEDFLSLGLGHFIWYPKDKTGPFEESFPVFVNYLKEKLVKLPDFLDKDPFPDCPWTSREDFLKNKQGVKAQELYHFLIETKGWQSVFLIAHLKVSLALMLHHVPEKNRVALRKQFNRVASTLQGTYVLADYANFKGLGISSSERYQGNGWGLLQVLSRMKGDKGGLKAINEFVQVADKVLTDRVNNAPADRQEQRWLLGWQNRIKSYLEKWQTGGITEAVKNSG